MKDNELRLFVIAQHILSVLQKNKEEAWVVGGAVRDLILNRPIKDIDIATTASPKSIEKIAHSQGWKTIPQDFGTVKVKLHDNAPIVDIAQLRSDIGIKDGRHPLGIEIVGTIEEDAKRRDFTINTAYLYFEGDDYLVEDPLETFINDCFLRTIRFVGDPEIRISEDKLRMLRAVRFLAQLGDDWNIEKESAEAIRRNAKHIKECSQERIRDELNHILMSNNVKSGLDTLYHLGLMKHILPKLHKCMKVTQNKHHAETVGEHLILCADSIGKKDLLLRWAGLLHDIAKPATKKYDKKKRDYTFYKHEVKSAFEAKEIMRRLKFSNRQIDKVFKLIYHHMYFIREDTKLATIRNRMDKVGWELVRDLLRLKMADRAANKAKSGISFRLKTLLHKIREIERFQKEFDTTMLALNGNDLQKPPFNLKPGPIIGKVKIYLASKVCRNPDLNDKNKLKRLAGKYLKKMNSNSNKGKKK